MKMFARVLLTAALLAFGATVASTPSGYPPLPCVPSCEGRN
jgi:hypothetical protein